jgi:general stress protein YciG
MSEDEAKTTTRTGRPRGFAGMDPAKVREISSKGGRAAHAQGTAHKFTTEEARAAGKKGGVAPHRTRGRRGAKKDEEPGPA